MSPRGERTWREAAADYCARRSAEVLTHRHVREIRRILERTIEHLEGAGLGCSPARFDRERLDFLLGGPWGPAKLSQRTRLYHVTILGAFLADAGNPIVKRARLRFPKSPVRPIEALKPDEAASLLGAELTLEEELWITLELTMGLRRSEVMRATVHAFASDPAHILGKGRSGGKTRPVPISAQVRAVLPAFLEERTARLRELGLQDNGVLIGHLYHGKWIPFSKDRADALLKRALVAGGVAPRPFNLHHALRRTFGRTLWDRDVDIEVIAKIMGHESTSTTLTYLAIDRDDMRAAVDKLTFAFGGGNNHEL